ncbi:hypothetical protein [Methylobacterium sp. E-046]|uniref:hypothetical protein n=1 Tax=Methylobacterium sp. E-046 TaxID=2836576 RepID=UPI001FB8E839|nr:hypothetical protein [Methylobacterium sp. E-046]MCJ2102233.1 hypothetical protein [Methylobacterium sp. E-046]
MRTIKSLFLKAGEFLSARPTPTANGSMIKSRSDTGIRENAGAKSRDFDGDFLSAGAMLRERMNKRYPDKYFVRAETQANNRRDYSDERAGAIDVSSAAIAVALREGATVKQAAEAGAASVGI